MDKKFFTFDSLHAQAPTTFPSKIPYTSYDSYDTISPQFSQGSPYHDTDSLSGDSKKIRKKRNTYQKIDDETRRLLLEAVKQGDTLKAASKRFNINYSSAKSILHTFRKEGRITKKSAHERMSRRRTKMIPQDLEMSPIYFLKQSQEENTEVHDASTHHSLEEKSENSLVCTQEDESPKAGVSGVAINTFGGFLKIGSQNCQRTESLSSKAPASLVLKLESQRTQSAPCADTTNIRGGNWQLNVNVHNENQPVYKYSEQPLFNELQNVPNNTYRPDMNENFYANQMVSPLAKVRKMKKGDNSAIKGYGLEDFQGPIDNIDDVSYFLNSSSPAYDFTQQSYGGEQYANINTENCPAMDYYRGEVNQPSQRVQYDGLNYGMKMTDRTAEFYSRAGLSSY